MSFADDIRKWAQKTKRSEDQVVRSVIFDLSSAVIKRTPVGNPTFWKSPAPKGYIGGTARGNWNLSIGVPDSSVDKSARNVAPSLNRIAAGIQNATGNIAYITNSVPYIRRLEYEGWSTQAPSGMVRVTVTEFNEAIKKAVSELQ